MSAFAPRPHQSSCLHATRRAVADGSRAPLIVAPTGAGKTFIGVLIASGALRKGGAVLWVTHRRELIDQTVASLQRAGVARVSVLRADDDRIDDGAAIVVASIQTLIARGKRPSASVVVLDEAHHYSSAQWGAVAYDYRNAIRIGLTATPERADGSALGDVFDSLVVAANYSELISTGLLVPCDVLAPSARLQGAIAQTPWDAYSAHGLGRPAVVFTSGVETAREAAREIAGARAVWGGLPGSERARILEDYQTGAIQVVSNAMVLTEGWDAPRAEVCILARGATTVSAYLQMCGRVLRPCKGKGRALLLDLVGAYHEHGSPTEDREYSLTGQAIRRGAAATLPLWQCKGCGLCTLKAPADRNCPRCGEPMPPPKRPRLKREDLKHVGGGWTCPTDDCGFWAPTMPPRCPDCGAMTARGARAQSESTDERKVYLDRLKATARERGYKFGWVMARYRAKYGDGRAA